MAGAKTVVDAGSSAQPPKDLREKASGVENHEQLEHEYVPPITGRLFGLIHIS